MAHIDGYRKYGCIGIDAATGRGFKLELENNSGDFAILRFCDMVLAAVYQKA